MTPEPRDRVDRRGGHPVDRRLGGELGADLELLARRQGQLRGRPQRRGPDRPRLPADRQGGPVLAGLPRPRGHFLAGEVGIRQFLDIGSGLPAADNVHEVARRVGRGLRGCVYVDSDPLVLSHIRARLLDPADELVNGIEADLARPEQILSMAAGAPGPEPPGRPSVLVQRARAPADLELASSVVQRLLGAAARRQPPGRRRQHERDRRRGDHGGRASCGTTPGQCAYQLRIAGRDRAAVRRPGAARTRRGVLPALAAADPDPGPGRRVLRGRPQGLASCGRAGGVGSSAYSGPCSSTDSAACSPRWALAAAGRRRLRAVRRPRPGRRGRGVPGRLDAPATTAGRPRSPTTRPAATELLVATREALGGAAADRRAGAGAHGHRPGRRLGRR